jgi:hypothetical protein
LEGSPKFGSRRLEELPRKPRNISSGNDSLKVLKVLKVHLFPRRGEPALSEVERGTSQAAKQPPTRGQAFPWRRILSDLGTSIGRPLVRRDHQERMNRISFHGTLW